jgi:guanylate kinase
VPGQIFVVTAPSGTGKTTLLKRLINADSRLRFSISYTSRAPRPGEISGRDYFFISPEEFRALKEAGALVEWVEQFGYGYGTSKEWVEQALASDQDLIFDLDPRGARSVKERFPEAVLIFILPPSLEELERRLEGRADLDPAELYRRLKQGRGEIKEAAWFDFLVINDDLDQAFRQLQAIITASRCCASQLWPPLAARYVD